MSADARFPAGYRAASYRVVKTVIAAAAALILTAFPAAADGNPDLYREEYSLTDADRITDSLPDETKRFLDSYGIDPSDPGWVGTLRGENVFSHILGFVKSGARESLRGAASILAILLLSSALPTLSVSEELGAAVSYAAVVGIGVFAAGPIWSAVTAAIGAAKGCSTFMLSFVPVYAGILTLSGKPLTSAAMSGLLLGAAEAVGTVVSFIVLPLMGGYLAVSLCTAVSPLAGKTALADGVKKIALWIFSLAATLFVGILGIQTAVQGAADSLALKTAKFLVGTAVPIAGPALSEATSTVTASLLLLQSSVGIYGVVALAAILLPILLELFLWRIALWFCNMAAALLTLPAVPALLHALDTMLSILLGVLLLIAAVFILSLTVVVKG